MYKLNISKNIVRFRHRKKITQEQLAEFIGVTKASVSKWENGQSTPDITILPQLATFFDITVDELIGFEPQLSKEQIQHLYQKFAKDFSAFPFEDVITCTKDYVKRYYSCYPFLLQICMLWLNHYMLAENEERQREIQTEIISLCEHIKSNCKDMQSHNTAVVIQALIYLQSQRVNEAMQDLEDISESNKIFSQAGVSALLAQAYIMLGKTDKADRLIQIRMYENVTDLFSNAGSYLLLHKDDLSVCTETINRVERMAEIYKLIDLNPNTLASFEYQAAVCYLTHDETQKAIEHTDKYVLCLFRLFASVDLKLHGDSYFNRLEEWFDNELENGANAPRDRKVVLEDAKKTLDVPPFTALEKEPAFKLIKNKLKELN